MIIHDDTTNQYRCDRNNTIFDNWNDYLYEILWSDRKPYLLASYHIYILIGCWCAAFFPTRNCLLLPLRISSGRGVGNLTRKRLKNAKQSSPVPPLVPRTHQAPLTTKGSQGLILSPLRQKRPWRIPDGTLEANVYGRIDLKWPQYGPAQSG